MSLVNGESKVSSFVKKKVLSYNRKKQTQLRTINCEMTKIVGCGGGRGGERRGRLKPGRISDRRRGEGMYLAYGTFVLGYEMIR
jgi:hypothetical protein